jgi:hypothetical protein
MGGTQSRLLVVHGSSAPTSADTLAIMKSGSEDRPPPNGS